MMMIVASIVASVSFIAVGRRGINRSGCCVGVGGGGGQLVIADFKLATVAVGFFVRSPGGIVSVGGGLFLFGRLS